MAWDELKFQMSVVGSDLVLNSGCDYGTYDTEVLEAVNDAAAGSLDWWLFRVLFTADPSIPGGKPCSYTLQFKYSEDNVTWTDYKPFGLEGEFYCRYFRFLITVRGDPATLQRPTLHAFDVSIFPASTVSVMTPVADQLTNPPASAEFGKNYLIANAGAGGAWAGLETQIAHCLGGQTTLWRYTKPRTGMWVHVLDTDRLMKYHGAVLGWVDVDPAAHHLRHENGGADEIGVAGLSGKLADVQDSHCVRQHCHGMAYDAVSGNWQWSLDALQDTNGYMETASLGSADGDYIDFKVGLQPGNYDLFLVGAKAIAGGKIDVRLQERAVPLIATFDEYNAGGGVSNVRFTATGIAITTGGVYTLRCLTNGTSGAGYNVFISWVCLAPA